jgi:sulfoxide reductase heme-binding subunit YedZ
MWRICTTDLIFARISDDRMDLTWQIRFIWKPLVFALCLVPFAIITGKVFGLGGTLGANPIEAIQDHFGEWGLRFVLIALAVTPLRKISGRAWLSRFRRMLGLFAFFYVFIHFIVWLVLDQELLIAAILEDIVERPFITIGMLAFLLLLSMAATSTAAMRRRMGQRWQKLHSSVYLIAVLGVWHYWWQVKKDITEPLIYALILSLLLGYRLWSRRKRKAPLPAKAEQEFEQ